MDETTTRGQSHSITELEYHVEARRTCSLDAIRAADAAACHERDIKVLEAGVMAAVANEMEAGKPRYSNAEKRQAEVERRLGTDPKFFEMRQAAQKYALDARILVVDAQYHADCLAVGIALLNAAK